MSSMDKNISPAVIKRLPRYYRYLGALKAKKYYEDLIQRAEREDESNCIPDPAGPE